ncbi:hypothetical protein QNA08_00035 [Chelatococcus sp. SYSU_G07232]|uniref:Response regulatory domain-containing protein n=1 Tax=Chelatococcus albus TaxID=3047466 RepID=A0ABT7ACT0_9HYPH|nr:hypothetical protein [Chelatococcus sp. SYSU_G07232]MDJ1156639.1 hypothetical protein [Chelatococcus sp. SYSU_G07232]
MILITGAIDSRLRARAAHTGIRTILEKPLSDDALRDSIYDALGRAS